MDHEASLTQLIRLGQFVMTSPTRARTEPCQSALPTQLLGGLRYARGFPNSTCQASSTSSIGQDCPMRAINDTTRRKRQETGKSAVINYAIPLPRYICSLLSPYAARSSGFEKVRTLQTKKRYKHRTTASMAQNRDAVLLMTGKTSLIEETQQRYIDALEKRISCLESRARNSKQVYHTGQFASP
jgi:hypothetical protein